MAENKEKENERMTKLLTKARSNLMWIFIGIQVLTLMCIFFEINIHNISEYIERMFWIVALYLSRKFGG
tara:strand:- start:230 stop:436 length:207 start_codon:yes stop_codon:yes gene_type:complete